MSRRVTGAAVEDRRWWGEPIGLRVLTAFAVVFGVVARVWPRSALWLDEAQSVAFAREPLSVIPRALRTDGAPPLYYLLLHVWIGWFGTGDAAVRSLSIVVSLLSLPVFFVAVRRLGGTRLAVIAVTLLATNSFAIRYATEGRMYALVVGLVSVGLLAVPALLRRPDVPRALVVAALVAALLWTHYWSLYLVAGLGVWTAATALRAWRRSRAGRIDDALRPALVLGAAIVVGATAWLPWFPSFRFQSVHTATPWTATPPLWKMSGIVFVHAGGHSPPALVLGSLFIVAIIAGAWPHIAAPGPAGDERGRLVGALARVAHTDALPAIPPVGVVAGVAAMCAVAGAIVSGSAFSGRYTSVLLPLTLLLVAAGVARLRDDRAVAAVLVVMASLSSIAVVHQARAERTPARVMATLLEARARPGDVVVFCPDQLGPAVARELAGTPLDGVVLGAYPQWSAPDRVDWVDYTRRYEAAWPAHFAATADRKAGNGSVWLVWSDLYPPTQAACRGLQRSLDRLRPAEQLLVADEPDRHLDHGALSWFPPSDRPRPSLDSLFTQNEDDTRLPIDAPID